MTLFELVKAALDELYKQGEKEHGEGLDDIVIKRINYLSESYGKLKDSSRAPVEYKETATRIAYVYSYVAAHADYIVQVLEQYIALKSLFLTDPLLESLVWVEGQEVKFWLF